MILNSDKSFQQIYGTKFSKLLVLQQKQLPFVGPSTVDTYEQKWQKVVVIHI